MSSLEICFIHHKSPTINLSCLWKFVENLCFTSIHITCTFYTEAMLAENFMMQHNPGNIEVFQLDTRLWHFSRLSISYKHKINSHSDEMICHPLNGYPVLKLHQNNMDRKYHLPFLKHLISPIISGNRVSAPKLLHIRPARVMNVASFENFIARVIKLSVCHKAMNFPLLEIYFFKQKLSSNVTLDCLSFITTT